RPQDCTTRANSLILRIRHPHLLCKVTASLDLLLQRVQRADVSILTRVDAGIVALRTVGLMQPLPVRAVAGRGGVGTRNERDSQRSEEKVFHGQTPKFK